MATFLSKVETDQSKVAVVVAEVASLSISSGPLKLTVNPTRATIGTELLITQEEMLEKQTRSMHKLLQELAERFSQLSASQAIVVHSARPVQLVPTSMDTPLARACPVSTNQRMPTTTEMLKLKPSAATNATSGKARRPIKNA